MVAVETGRRIRGEGHSDETQWRTWLGLLDPPALAIDELLGADQRLVVVSPHPDDEVLACGGLIALHADRGGDIEIVAVTDGEASHPGDPDGPNGRLAAARCLERAEGLERLGAADSPVTRLALRDGRLQSSLDVLRGRLRPLLKPTDFVVTTWRLDGHPDHEATGAATATVCAELGCAVVEAPVWMWHWSAPGDTRVPWDRLRALALPADAMARKAAALAAHRTQLAPRRGSPPVLGTAILARAARTAEYFLVGPAP